MEQDDSGTLQAVARVDKSVPTSNNFDENETSFLSLPRELRDKIYYLALVTTTPIHIGRSISSVSPLNTWPSDSRAGLCLVNRQIAKEAAESLYSLNYFTFSSASALEWFSKTIGARNRESVKYIRIYGHHYGGWDTPWRPWDGWSDAVEMCGMLGLERVNARMQQVNQWGVVIRENKFQSDSLEGAVREFEQLRKLFSTEM